MPRLLLLTLCAAYVLPGVIGRDPWKNADLTAFGQMVAMAEGRTPWWAPALGGLPVDGALLPHWMGASAITLLGPILGAPLAARLPFALLLAATLALVWYCTFHLARTDAAQPLPFAFGGEAERVDYARAMADGAVLALMATLGLLLLGHETTPELAQLFAMALFLYALAAAPFHPARARIALVLALPLLAGSGAPTMALLAGLGGCLVCSQSRIAQARELVPWLLGAMLAAALLGWTLGAWRWRLQTATGDDALGIARQWLWFMWPAWPLAAWTMWRWRKHLSHRHISVPLVGVLVGIGANLAMAGSDRALMLALPGLAVLAAFALPTLKRSATAAIDWFSMFFFSAWALIFWVHYIALQTGSPPRPAANMARLAPEFEAMFSGWALLFAAAGTVAWLALLRWRTGRQRDALWKSLVLPAGGVTLCWLLAMTLLLPPLDYMRSPRDAVLRMAKHIPAGSCVLAPGVSAPNAAALETFGKWRVEAHPDALDRPAPACNTLLRLTRDAPASPPSGWHLIAEFKRPADRGEVTSIYRRDPPP